MAKQPRANRGRRRGKLACRNHGRSVLQRRFGDRRHASVRANLRLADSGRLDGRCGSNMGREKPWNHPRQDGWLGDGSLLGHPRKGQHGIAVDVAGGTLRQRCADHRQQPDGRHLGHTCGNERHPPPLMLFGGLLKQPEYIRSHPCADNQPSLS